MIRFERSLYHWKALELGFQNMPKEPGKYFEKRQKIDLIELFKQPNNSLHENLITAN